MQSAAAYFKNAARFGSFYLSECSARFQKIMRQTYALKPIQYKTKQEL
jgi:hypothetical protein